MKPLMRSVKIILHSTRKAIRPPVDLRHLSQWEDKKIEKDSK